MLKRNKQKKKLNNKGMTLVELIITITVLALVSGFILSAFVSAMRTSARSRDIHRATTVAQNIMEGLNLKNAEDLAYQFNYPVVSNATLNIDNFKVYPSMMFEHGTQASVGELFEWTDPASGDVSVELVGTNISPSDYKALTDDYDKAATPSAYMADITDITDSKDISYDFIKDPSGKYIYYMRNIMNDGRYYNARIKVDASNYKSTGFSGISANSDALVSVPNMNSDFDAVEVMSNTLDSTAMTMMEDYNPGETVTDNNLYRIIQVTIDSALTPSGTDYRTIVKVDYYYYIRKADGSLTTPMQVITTNTAFDNIGEEKSKKLRNVYLYYYPLYGSTTASCKDYITIKNDDNMDIELYLIKQEKQEFDGMYMELENKENSYGMTFNVVETTYNADGKSHITLHSNLGSNLASIYTHSAYTPNQTKYQRNGVPATKDMFNTTDIKNKQAQDRIFDVTVDIYRSESMDATTFTAQSVEDWFSEDNYLMTVTSSISQ